MIFRRKPAVIGTPTNKPQWDKARPPSFLPRFLALVGVLLILGFSYVVWVLMS